MRNRILSGQHVPGTFLFPREKWKDMSWKVGGGKRRLCRTLTLNLSACCFSSSIERVHQQRYRLLSLGSSFYYQRLRRLCHREYGTNRGCVSRLFLLSSLRPSLPALVSFSFADSCVSIFSDTAGVFKVVMELVLSLTEPSRELISSRLLIVRSLGRVGKNVLRRLSKLTQTFCLFFHSSDVQITGVGDLTKLNIPAGDDGGELGSSLLSMIRMSLRNFELTVLCFLLVTQILTVSLYLSQTCFRRVH